MTQPTYHRREELPHLPAALRVCLARYWLAADLIHLCLGSDIVVLDAPCGIGEGSAILDRAYPEQWPQVYGIDTEEDVIITAQDTFSHGEIPIHFQVGDLHALPYPFAYFDAVVSLGGLDGCDPESLVQEFSRVLKPEGLLFASISRTPPHFPTPESVRELLKPWFSGSITLGTQCRTPRESLSMSLEHDCLDEAHLCSDWLVLARKE